MSAAAKHREAIVRTAATLFRRNGYAATGTNEIVAASGAPKGSLYHYFPDGKAAIAAAALGLAGDKVTATLTKLAADHDDAAGMLRAYARLLGGWMAKSGFRDGCPITTTLLEMAPTNAAIAEQGRDVFAGWSAIFAAKLEGDGIKRQRAVRLAGVAIAALTGALIQARTLGSAAPITSAAEEMAALFEAAMA